jgi:hypothetical protein
MNSIKVLNISKNLSDIIIPFPGNFNKKIFIHIFNIINNIHHDNYEKIYYEIDNIFKYYNINNMNQQFYDVDWLDNLNNYLQHKDNLNSWYYL